MEISQSGPHSGPTLGISPVWIQIGDAPMWKSHRGTDWGIAGLSPVWHPYVAHRVPHWGKLVHSEDMVNDKETTLPTHALEQHMLPTATKKWLEDRATWEPDQQEYTTALDANGVQAQQPAHIREAKYLLVS
jgi:hypothetical protein